MSEEKPKFKRKIPVPGVPAPGDSSVSPEDLGAERVIPDPQGTIIGKVPEEKTRVVGGAKREQPAPESAPSPPQQGVGQDDPRAAPSASEMRPLGANLPPAAGAPSFSGGNIPGTTPEPRPVAFTPGVSGTSGLSTFDEDENDEGGSGAALLIAIAAFLVAVLGLLVSIGIVPLGPSTDLIGQERLADNSVGEPQLQEQSVSLSKIQPDILDELKGPAGSRGPAGPRGEAGPPGAALGIIEIRSKEFSGTSTSSKASGLITCSAGEVLLSGGASLSGAEGKVVIVSSNPSSESNAWFAESARIDPENSDPWTLTVYARCAKKTKPDNAGNQNEGQS